MLESFISGRNHKEKATEKANEANFWLTAFLRELNRIDDHLHFSSVKSSRFAEVIDLCKEIQRNPEEEWDIGDLAERFICSKDHFIRIFRRYKGMTPNEFIIHARIESSKNHLRLSNLTIEEVASLLGYKTSTFFSRQFKKITGVSPSQYRADPGP